MKPVLFHRLARAEIVDAAHHYERKQPGLGARFVAVVMATATTFLVVHTYRH